MISSGLQFEVAYRPAVTLGGTAQVGLLWFLHFFHSERCLSQGVTLCHCFTYARFYQLGITRETRVIPGIRNNNFLSTPNL